MPALTAPGLGSGLDINGIVAKLMEVERAPLQRLQSEEKKVKDQLSAFGKFKSALSSFKDAMGNLSSVSKFKIYNAATSDENVLAATAEDTAAPGTYNIDVTSLASHHKLATAAFASSGDTLGTGRLDISVGTASFSVDIDAASSTLTGIRDAINQSPDNTGVTATILHDDAGYRLILTADESGTENALQVSASGSGLAPLASLTEVSPAADAQMTIDGFTVTSASNKVGGAIQGVTLELKALGNAEVTLTRNNEAIQESVQSFADAYNALQDSIDSLSQGELEADSTLRTVQNSILSVINTPANIAGSAYSYMSEVGLSIGKDGRMSIDPLRLEKALDTDFYGFSNVFGHDTEGFAARLDTMVEGFLGVDGIIKTREDGFNSRIRRIGDQQANMEYRLQTTEKRIRTQFAGLDTLMSQMQATGQFLTQRLGTLK